MRVGFDSGFGQGRVQANDAGQLYVVTNSGEQQFLETGSPQSAVHNNAGFEDETAGTPDVWSFFWSTGTTTNTSETTVVYSGDKSLKVHINSGGGSQIVESNVFDVSPGGRVDFSTFACKRAGSPTINLGLLTRASGSPDFFDGGTGINEVESGSLGTDWARYSHSATVPAGHTKARVFFRVEPAATEAVDAYLDLTSSAVLNPAGFVGGEIDEATLSAPITPVGTANSTLTGLSCSVTPQGPTNVYRVTISADVAFTGAQTNIIELLVDGVAVTFPQLVNQAAATGYRVSSAKTWHVTGLAGGSSHTFTAQTRNDAAGSNALVYHNQTTMHVEQIG